jgi:DNA-binding transcriptional MerR regulator
MLALDENKVTLAELEQFYPLKVELGKLGIFVEDIPRTIRIIQGVQKSGYNVDTIKQVLSAWEASRVILAQLEKNIEELTDKQRNIQEESDRLEEQIFIHRQKVSFLTQLQNMGIGLKELKLLVYTIKEVSAEKKIPEYLAVQKFFSDIEKDYDTKKI